MKADTVDQLAADLLLHGNCFIAKGQRICYGPDGKPFILPDRRQPIHYCQSEGCNKAADFAILKSFLPEPVADHYCAEHAGFYEVKHGEDEG